MPHGVHTARQVPEERRQVIRESLAAGNSTKQTARLVHCATNTASLIRAEDASQIAITSAQIAANLDTAALTMSERLANQSHELPITSIPIALAVILDKRAMLRGIATTIIEHRSVEVEPQSLRDAIDALPSCGSTETEPVVPAEAPIP